MRDFKLTIRSFELIMTHLFVLVEPRSNLRDFQKSPTRHGKQDRCACWCYRLSIVGAMFSKSCTAERNYCNVPYECTSTPWKVSFHDKRIVFFNSWKTPAIVVNLHCCACLVSAVTVDFLTFFELKQQFSLYTNSVDVQSYPSHQERTISRHQLLCNVMDVRSMIERKPTSITEKRFTYSSHTNYWESQL